MSRDSTSQDAVRVIGHRLEQVNASVRVADDEQSGRAPAKTSANGQHAKHANGQPNGHQVVGEFNIPTSVTTERTQSKAPSRAPTQSPDATGALRQVILVDREIDGLRDIAIALRDDYDFHLTISGAEALNLLRDGSIDTIVVGQNLYSSTGLNVLAEARQHAPHTHRVLLANAVEAGSIDRGAPAAPFAMMQRPCTVEKLRELLETLGKHTAPTAMPTAKPKPVAPRVENPIPELAERIPTQTHDPADFEHVVMETPPERPRRGKTGRGSAVDNLPVIVYTDNAEFYQAISVALQDRHDIRLCTQLDNAAELAEMGMCPLLITDRAGTQVELQRITIPLRALDAGMITIASGGPEVGAPLRKLLGTPALHSFLPKPLSAPLVRLAVESAKRQYVEARANRENPQLHPADLPPPKTSFNTKAATSTTTMRAAQPSIYVPAYRNDFNIEGFDESPWREAAPKIAMVAAAVIVTVIGLWLGWREYGSSVIAKFDKPTKTEVDKFNEQQPAPAVPIASPDNDLALAKRAFDAGHYSGDSSAIFHYGRALRIAPQNTIAKTGLELSLERVIEQAEKALTDERPEAAAAAIAAVRAAQPANKRLAFLENQLAKQRRQLTANRGASGTTNTGTTQATSTLTNEPISNETQRQQLIVRWLASARQRVAQDRLTAPENDNAEFYFRQVERADPGNPNVQQGIKEIGTKLIAQARDALTRQQLDLAKTRANESLRFGVDREVVDRLRVEIDSVANTNVRTGLLRTALQRTRENQLFEPERDNAKYYLLQLQRSAPASTETEQALRALALKLIENADQALAQRQINSATQMLNEARRLGYTGPELSAADARARTARSPAPATTAPTAIPPPKALKIVQPKFPDDAMRAGAEGWVDVRFTIAASGDVTDVAPVGTNTPAPFAPQFERAAVAAIRDYKFESRPISETQTQSMVVRVQFKLQ